MSEHIDSGSVILAELATFIASSHKDGFLQKLTELLYRHFDVNYVHIAMLQPQALAVKIVAGVLDGTSLEPGYIYELRESPCHNVVGHAHKCYIDEVQKLFPNDLDLQSLGAKGYIGEPIDATDGSAIGLVVMISRKPLHSSSLMVDTLKIVANYITQQVTAKELDLQSRRYKHIMQSASDGIIIHNHEHQIVDFNYKAKEMLGYSNEEMLHLNIFDFDVNFSKDKIKELSDEVQKRTIQFETLHRRRNGTVYNAAVTANLIWLDNESFFYTSIRDITHEKETQRTLLESQTLLKTVIEEMPDILVVKDENAKFILANSNVAALYNTTPEAMVGKADEDFGVPKELADSFRENVLSIMKKGKMEIVYEDSKDAKTGEIRHFKSIKKPFKSFDGKNRILVIAHDITEHLLVKEKIEAEHAKLNTILQTTQDAFWLADEQGVIIDLNPAMEALYGYAREEAIGMHVSQLDVYDDMEAAKARIQYLIEQGSARFETQHLCKDNSIVDAEVTITHIPKQQLFVVFSRNITARKKYQRELSNQRTFLQTLIHSIPDLVWLKDTQGVYLACNKRFEDFFGAKEDKIIGKTDYDFVHKELADFFREDDKNVMTNNQTSINEEEIVFASDGHRELIQATKIPIYDEQGKLMGVLGIGHDITELKAHENQLEHIAHYDPLTGLANRLLFSDRLHQAIAQANRGGHILAVTYLDLDGFKEVNDKHGHDVGDRLLVSIAHRLKGVLREEDIIARLGGDEFVCVMVDLNDPAAGIPIIERMLEVVKEPVAIDGELLEVSASIGVTFYKNNESIDADQLIRQSDVAMYEAKQSGKNRFHIFDTEYDKSLRSHYENIERIKEAFENEEFALYYQPKVNMKTGEITGAEALIRWLHPQKGLIPPVEFLPTIDNHLLIVELGYWVIEKAMVFLASQDERICLPVSVNIHAMQLQQHDFVMRVEKLLGKYPQIKAGMIEFEILETSALEDISSIKEIILECRDLGIGFSLDDFGTGYSSLTYLKQLPVDTLKIDSSFVIDMLEDEDDHAIVKGIVDLSKTFNRKVIAEGVETLAHCQALLALGCENAQGYFIAKPMHPQKLQEWIENWSVENLQN